MLPLYSYIFCTFIVLDHMSLITSKIHNISYMHGTHRIATITNFCSACMQVWWCYSYGSLHHSFTQVGLNTTGGREDVLSHLSIIVISPQKANAIGWLCKLLDGQCQGPLQSLNFCPILTSIIHSYHLRHVTDDPLSLQQLIWFNYLNLFINSFLGTIYHLFGLHSHKLYERGAAMGWTAVHCTLQKHFI